MRRMIIIKPCSLEKYDNKIIICKGDSNIIMSNYIVTYVQFVAHIFTPRRNVYTTAVKYIYNSACHTPHLWHAWDLGYGEGPLPPASHCLPWHTQETRPPPDQGQRRDITWHERNGECLIYIGYDRIYF